MENPAMWDESTKIINKAFGVFNEKLRYQSFGAFLKAQLEASGYSIVKSHASSQANENSSEK